MDAASDLALAYVSEGKFTQSEPPAREAFEFDRKHLPDNWRTFRTQSLLGASLAGQKIYAEAEPLLVEGYRSMPARKDRMEAFNWYQPDRAHDWLVQLFQVLGKPANCRVDEQMKIFAILVFACAIRQPLASAFGSDAGGKSGLHRAACRLTAGGSR